MILITGATGLIGSHLLYRLVSSGEPVRVLVRDPERLSGIRKVFSYYTGQPDDLMHKFSVVQGDLLDLGSVEIALEGVDRVYHCAAIVSFNPAERERLIEQNTRATANLVNACLAHGVGKLVHVSSTSAVGDAKGGALITEDCEWHYGRHHSGYSVSKYESEREAWRGEAEGMQVVIVNPAMVLGPGNWGESSTRLIDQCYRGLNFYTEGINAYVDVRDVAEVMTLLMEGDITGERYILAAENISFRSLFSQVASALGKPAPRFRARRWMGELVWRLERIRSLVTGKSPLVTRETARTSMSGRPYSSEKIQKATGFRFRPLSETIGWTCSHYLNDLDR